MERYNKSNIERIIDLENKVDKLILCGVSQQRELLPAFLERRGDDIITLNTAGTDVTLDWQEYLKACNCG